MVRNIRGPHLSWGDPCLLIVRPPEVDPAVDVVDSDCLSELPLAREQVAELRAPLGSITA